jgi:hypothetical protein
MRVMRIFRTTSQAWDGGGCSGLSVPGVLHTAGVVGTSEPGTSRRDAGHDCQVPGRTWPGRGAGVRAPGDCETPLSRDEVRHGLRAGVLP